MLKTELRKITGEVLELREKWDKTVDALFITWMDASSEVFQTELWRVRLSSSVLQAEELHLQEATIRSEMKAKTMQKSQATQAAKAYYRQVERASSELEKLLNEDKTKEKLFKKEFSDAAEIMDQLLALWKQVRPSKLTVAASHSSLHTNRYRAFGSASAPARGRSLWSLRSPQRPTLGRHWRSASGSGANIRLYPVKSTY